MRIKKLITLTFIAVVVLLLSYVNTFAATWNFIWENTYVKIPVGDALYDYSNVPTATLYKDGEALTDAKITYSRDGDWLYYLKDVNTSKVGIYKVWYKAGEYDKYKPGTCTGYKALITFEVYDNISPQVNIISDVINIERLSIDSSELDSYLLSNVIVSDNYSTNIETTVSHSIDINTIGLYECKVLATDESGNITRDKFLVNVYYDDFPSLSCTNSDNVIYVNLDDKIDLKDYIKAYDRLDGDITDKILYDKIDSSYIHDYDTNIYVTNSSELTSILPVHIYIIDDVSPVITLKYESINLDYKTDLDTFDFAYYATVSDNNVIIEDNFIYETNICNKVGVYDVTYYYSDGFNSVEKTMNIRMLSYEAPKIIVEDISIKKNSNIDLRNYITIYDESDSYAKETLVIDDSQVDYKADGTYYVTVSCHNTSGLYSEKKFIVYIESDLINSNNIGLFITLMVLLGLIIISLVIVLVIFIIKRKKQFNTKSSI